MFRILMLMLWEYYTVFLIQQIINLIVLLLQDVCLLCVTWGGGRQLLNNLFITMTLIDLNSLGLNEGND